MGGPPVGVVGVVLTGLSGLDHAQPVFLSSHPARPCLAIRSVPSGSLDVPEDLMKETLGQVALAVSRNGGEERLSRDLSQSSCGRTEIPEQSNGSSYKKLGPSVVGRLAGEKGMTEEPLVLRS